MNGYLKQSTASQARLIGPFLDDTDFKTAETGLTIANTDVKLRANGTTLSNKNSGGGTHQVNGMYSLTWDATDTANVGELFFSVVVSGALPVFGSYTVVEEAIYDELFASGATGAVASVTGAVGSVTGNVGGNVVGSVASVTGNVGGNVTGSVGSLGATAKSDVNAEVVDALNVDTYAESSAVPSATATLVAKIGWLMTVARNKITQTATTQTLRNDADAGTVATSTVSDDGTTFTRGKWT